MSAVISRIQLDTGLEFIEKLFLARLHAFNQQSNFVQPPEAELMDWVEDLMQHLPVNAIKYEEVILLTLALIPHVRPYFFDQLTSTVYPKGGLLLHLGGLRGKQHRGFLPTVETALFLLAGKDFALRFKIQKLLAPDHWLLKQHILTIGEPEKLEPQTSSQLSLEQEYVERITLGKISRPVFSSTFPAHLLDTAMTWEDLVLPPKTLKQIEEIQIWLKYHTTLMNDLGLGRKLKSGYRALFHGPPGTGKTLTANLLGKHTGREVYRVDLSAVVSKYIGETEKNLSGLFDKAENKEWILFFDEADALFGSRTQVQNAHDRYANQEVSYLLQRIENHHGLVILASNFKSNIDEAFIRRFQSIIHFPIPKTQDRLRLWQQAFPAKIHLKDDVHLKSLAQNYDLTGADIMNVVQYVCLGALSKGKLHVSYADITEAIKREFIKHGKISY